MDCIIKGVELGEQATLANIIILSNTKTILHPSNNG